MKKNTRRILVFAAGFLIGCGIVAILQQTRTPPENDDDPKGIGKQIVQRLMETSEIRPLPKGSPEYLRNSRLLEFGQFEVPPETELEESGIRRIWLLEILDDPTLPPVRVEELLDANERSIEYTVTAADRLLLLPAEEVSPREFDLQLKLAGYEKLGRFQTGWVVVQLEQENLRPLDVDLALQRLSRMDTPWLAEAKPYPILRR